MFDFYAFLFSDSQSHSTVWKKSDKAWLTSLPVTVQRLGEATESRGPQHRSTAVACSTRSTGFDRCVSTQRHLDIIMLKLFTALLVLLGGAVQASKLALTPPMGWMSWEVFRCRTDCTGSNAACETASCPAARLRLKNIPPTSLFLDTAHIDWDTYTVQHAQLCFADASGWCGRLCGRNNVQSAGGRAGRRWLPHCWIQDHLHRCAAILEPARRVFVSVSRIMPMAEMFALVRSDSPYVGLLGAKVAGARRAGALGTGPEALPEWFQGETNKSSQHLLLPIHLTFPHLRTENRCCFAGTG